MTKENTANLMGKCLNGKMSIREHFSVIFNIFKSNIKDMVIIGTLLSLPVAFMFTVGFGGIIASLVHIFCASISMASITLLIDGKAKGINMNWKSAIKKAFTSPMLALGAFLIQTLLMSFFGGFLGILVGSFVMLNIQFAVLAGMDMFSSTKASFTIVSKNLIDVLIKKILLNFLTAIPTAIIMTIAIKVLGVNQLTGASFGLVFVISGILTTISVASSVVFYYNLPTVSPKVRA